MKSNFFVSLAFLALTVLICSTLSVEAQYRKQDDTKEGSPSLTENRNRRNVDVSDSDSASDSDEEDEEENIREKNDADDVPLNRRPRDVLVPLPPPKEKDSDEKDSDEKDSDEKDADDEDDNPSDPTL